MSSGERARIRRAFGDVVARQGDEAPEYSLVFRASRTGPNALAGARVTAFEGLLAEMGSQDRGWLSTHPGLGARVERARAFLGTPSADPTAP
mgnify:CR=1 FL=1